MDRNGTEKDKLPEQIIGWAGRTNQSKYKSLITWLEESNFYGNLELNFENGKIVHGRKTESIKF